MDPIDLKSMTDDALVKIAKVSLARCKRNMNNDTIRNMEDILDEGRRRRGVARPESPTPESKKQVRFKRSRPTEAAENWAWDVVMAGKGIPSRTLIEAKALAYDVTSGRLRQMCQAALNTQKKSRVGTIKFKRPNLGRSE